MAAAKPFSFDELQEEAPPPARVYSAGDLEQARQRGRSEAVSDLVAKEAAEQTKLLERISAQIASDREAFNAAIDAHRAILSEAAKSLVMKFCERASAEKEGEIAITLLGEYLQAAPDLKPAALILSKTAKRKTLTAVKKAVTQADAGEFITVKQSQTVEKGDCRIEWRGGALSHDLQTALSQIDEIFSSTDLQPRKAT